MARKDPSQTSDNNSSARDPSGAIAREQAQAVALDAGLYVVATPIGNLRDISLRALDVLASADLIVCEDTRVTRRLLNRYAITTKTLSYNDHNAPRVLPTLMERLNHGESLALVSDAGTPLISDPGYRLVEATAASGIAIFPIPGANAALAGLVASALPTDAFFFAGFLPPKQAARRKRLAELSAIPGSLVFYESPGRLAGMLADLRDVLGEREGAVAREITKLYEEVIRGSLVYLAEHYAAQDAPRGEIVVIVGPPGARTLSSEDVDDALRDALQSMSVRDAASDVAEQTGRPRREIYNRALSLSADDDDR